MGVYLNSKKSYLLYQEDVSAAYFVDKTDILKELVPLIELKGNIAEKDGKSQGKGVDSRAVFQGLKVSECDWFEKHLNKHNVIHITFNETPRRCKSYEQYIDRIESRLVADLMREFPDAHIREDDAVWDALNNIIEFGNGEKFIFILDEWDFIFYPLRRDDDCIILELKVNHIAEEAVQQIKNRKYALKFKGKIGEDRPYTGRILAVGIAYDKATKVHTCKIEEL